MEEMEHRTLSDIICDNTIIEKVQEQALLIPHPVTNPIRVCQRSAEAQKQTEEFNNGNIESVTSAPAVPETTRQPQQHRVPKSLRPPSFAFSQPFQFETLRPRHSNVFRGRQHQSIFEAFRNLQTRDFQRLTNSSIIKPVKFLERFDHSDAIILNP